MKNQLVWEIIIQKISHRSWDVICVKNEFREQFLLSQCSSYLNELVDFNADYQFYKCLKQIQADKYMWVWKVLNFDFQQSHSSARKSGNKIWHFYRAFIWLLEDNDLDNFSASTILAKVSLFLECVIRYPRKVLATEY